MINFNPFIIQMENSCAVNKSGDGSCIEKTSIGGQAIIEGLMMIGPKKAAIAVRLPNKEIKLEIKPIRPKSKLQKVPVLRGVVNLFRQLTLGVRALMYSAEFFEIEDEEENAEGTVESTSTEESAATVESTTAAEDTSAEDKPKSVDKVKDIVVYSALVLALCFSVGLFILLPNLIVSLFRFDKTVNLELLTSNLIEGAVRVTIFLGYMILTSRMKEIHRVWQYHGAEHKTIHCHEHGKELTIENVRSFSTKHPRCGTSFLFLVMIISILVFSFGDLIMLQLPFQIVGVARILLNLVTRIIMIPFVAGMSFEVIKVAGKYDNLATRIISAPGLMFQRFTTKEPDDSMIEVAILAFNSALSGGEVPEMLAE